MTDFSQITPGVDAQSARPTAATAEAVYDTILEVVRAFPGLTEPDAADDLARLVTHFARGRAFRVIHDPAAFQDAYRTRVDSEDPSQPWQQSQPRLVDAGLPDFTEIVAPSLSGGTLAWTVEDSFTGLPYRARVSLEDLESASFTPMALAPIAPTFVERRASKVISLGDDAEEEDLP
ncbi:MAG: hypothetical protein AAGB05_14680 [Pseudomonadota bacterium]